MRHNKDLQKPSSKSTLFCNGSMSALEYKVKNASIGEVFNKNLAYFVAVSVNRVHEQSKHEIVINVMQYSYFAFRQNE